jgi:hypothetical protein
VLRQDAKSDWYEGLNVDCTSAILLFCSVYTNTSPTRAFFSFVPASSV